MISKDNIKELETFGFRRNEHIGKSGSFWIKEFSRGNVAISKDGSVWVGPVIDFMTHNIEMGPMKWESFNFLLSLFMTRQESINWDVSGIVKALDFLDFSSNSKTKLTGDPSNPLEKEHILNLSSYNPNNFGFRILNKKTMETETIKIEGLEIRPEVVDFAKSMELVLRKNDYKGGWETTTISVLIERLENELSELSEGFPEEGPIALMLECVDIANYAMMIRDNIGRGRK